MSPHKEAGMLANGWVCGPQTSASHPGQGRSLCSWVGGYWKTVVRDQKGSTESRLPNTTARTFRNCGKKASLGLVVTAGRLEGLSAEAARGRVIIQQFLGQKNCP